MTQFFLGKGGKRGAGGKNISDGFVSYIYSLRKQKHQNPDTHREGVQKWSRDGWRENRNLSLLLTENC